MPLSFSAPREEAPYLHSRTEPQQCREKSLTAVFAPSQTSWVASGDVAAPATPVEPQREAVCPIFLNSCNNSVPFSPLSDHILNGLVSVGGTLARHVPGSVWESFIALPLGGSYHVLTCHYIVITFTLSRKCQVNECYAERSLFSQICAFSFLNQSWLIFFICNWKRWIKECF